jgi:hypothetical protein
MVADDCLEYCSLLQADSARLQAQLSYQQALALLTEDFIALQNSHGLGWDPA